MAFLLSLFFGICVFALVLMMLQHYGLVREQPIISRTESPLLARSSAAPAGKPRKEGGFSLFGAIAGFFASLRGKKDAPKEAAPVTPLGVKPEASAMQPVRPLGVSPDAPASPPATPLGVSPAVPETKSAAPTDAKPSAPEAVPAAAAARRCPKCGTEVLDDGAFCWQCGTKIDAPLPADRTDKTVAAPTLPEKKEPDALPKDILTKPEEPKEALTKPEEPKKESSGLLGKAALPAAAAAGVAAAGLAVAAAKREAAPEPAKAAPVETAPVEPAAAPGGSALETGSAAPEPKDTTADVPPVKDEPADDNATTITTLRGSRLAIKPCKTDANFVPYSFDRVYTQPARLSSYTVLYFLQANGYTDSVIEIGIAPVEDGKLKKATSFFVRPPYDDFNSRKTRLTLDDVKNSPTFAELWPTIEEYIRENVVAVYGATVHLACLLSTLAYYGIEAPSFVAFDIKETVQGLRGDDPGKDDLVSLAKKGEMPLDKDNAKDCAVFAAQIQMAATADNPKLENRLMLFADRDTVMEQMADGALAPESVEKESRKLLAETEGKPFAEVLPSLAAIEGSLFYAPNATLAEKCAAVHAWNNDAEGATMLREFAKTGDPTGELVERLRTHLSDLARRLEQ